MSESVEDAPDTPKRWWEYPATNEPLVLESTRRPADPICTCNERGSRWST